MSYILFGFDVEQADSTTRQAIRVAQKINDQSGEGWATAYRGVYLLFSGSLQSAQENFTRALERGRDLDENNLQAYSLNQLGNVFRDKGVFDSAIYFYRQAEAVISKKPDPYYQSVVKMNKGRYYLILSKPDSALLEINEARKLREDLNEPDLTVDVWLALGNCFRQKYEFKEAEQYYKRVLKNSSRESTIHAQYLLNMGEVSFSRGDFPGALNYWRQALAYHRKLNYKYELAFILLRMGEAFEEQGYYDLAIEYLTNSLKISEKARYGLISADVYYELAWVFYRNKNLELATQSIHKARELYKNMKQDLGLAGCLNVEGLVQLKKGNYDSALFYHQQSLKDRERIGDMAAVSSSLYNLGELYNARKEYKKALLFLGRGVKLDETIGDDYGKSLYYYQIGKSYNLLGMMDSAIFYLDKSVRIAIPTSATDVLRNSYFEIATYLQKVGKPNEAINYYKKFIQLTDTLFNKQTSESLASYRTLYEVEKKEREIELLNKDNLLIKTQVQKQRILFYVAGTGLLILIGMAIFYYRFAKRLKKLNFQILEKSQEVQTQSEELTGANEVLSDLNQELEKSNKNLKDALDDVRKTQEKLIQSEKMASLGVLSAGVAHELNNPLNFIKGGVNALGIQIQDLNEDKQREVKVYIDIINEGVNRASVILKGLSHYSRQTDRQNEPCDIHKILDNCLLILSNTLKHRIVIEKDYSRSVIVMTGNEGRLHQAFLNILSNAEQAIPGMGTIHIKTNVMNDIVSISIADTGSGLSKENLLKISDPFFTTKPPGEGTGLGLSITYKIIETHGGKISVSSEPGKGTDFLILFPLS